jgi:hypothetical protein
MTPREIKDLFYTAADSNDATLALQAAKEFKAQELWTSTAHYIPIEPDGTERRIQARRPGTCVLCHREFSSGEVIRWRSRVDCHEDCWTEKFII